MAGKGHQIGAHFGRTDGQVAHRLRGVEKRARARGAGGREMGLKVVNRAGNIGGLRHGHQGRPTAQGPSEARLVQAAGGIGADHG